MWKTGNIYVIAAIAVVGGALFGFDISSMSAIIGAQPYRCYYNQQGETDDGNCRGPTPPVQGGITAAMPAGSWLGALISGYVSDILGRKKAIMTGAVIWCVGSIITCASVNIPMLVVGRIINGFSVGIESAQVPVYISECAPPSKRGGLVACQQWAITWGILIMYYMSFGASYIGGNTPDTYSTTAFRLPWGLQMIPAVILFCGMLILPESPRWLARKDRWEDCERVLNLIHSKGDPNSSFVANELREIQEMTAFEARNADVTYFELFRWKNINRTHIGMAMQIWSQLTGMNVMMYYITYVFEMAGYSGNSNLIASSIQYIINVVMTVPAIIYIDRWGRRPTLLIGAFFMAIWMFTNAGVLAAHGTYVEGGVNGNESAPQRLDGAAANALIASTYLFVASYAPTWGPVSWAYPPELFPQRLRGKAVALATSSNWAFNTALGAFVPESFAEIAWRTYIIFGVFLVAAWIHVFFMFPETASRTLEETTAIFEDPNGIPYIGTPAWKTRNDHRRIKAMEASGHVSNEKESAIRDDSPDHHEAAPTKETV